MSPQREIKINKKYVLRFFFLPILVGLLSCFGNKVEAQSLPDTVKVEDNLKEVAEQHDLPFWKLLFEANKNATPNTDSLDQNVDTLSFEEFTQTINRDRQQTVSENDQDSLKLKKFREAFEKIIDRQDAQNTEGKEVAERMAKEKEIRNGLNIGGLVINKTRSKMGRDFFNAFYDKWDSPEDTGNFMLEISEQPVPSMGAMVLVKIDNTIIYKARLQPRDSVIQKKAEKSIRICHQYIQQQNSSTKNLSY